MLQILYSGLGGHGSVAFSLVRGDEAQDMSHSLLFYGVEELKPEYASLCDELEVKSDLVIKGTGLDLKSWITVWKALKRDKPDILVLHSMTLAPVVLAYQSTHACKVLFVDHQPNAVKKQTEWISTGLASMFGQHLVVLTDTASTELQKRLGTFFRHKKISVINNGIDIDRFSPGENRGSRSDIRIVMQARFSTTKDQASLVLAFAKAVTQCPDMRLILPGDGETWLKVKELVESLSLGDLVELPGMLNEEELIACLRNADFYVHSSLGETMSTAVMQAMSVGLGVIGTDIPGINDVLEAGVSGSLYPLGNIDELASQLTRWARDDSLREQMGIQARATAVSRFSHVQMFKRYAAAASL